MIQTGDLWCEALSRSRLSPQTYFAQKRDGVLKCFNHKVVHHVYEISRTFSCFPVNVVFVCSQVREKPTLYYILFYNHKVVHHVYEISRAFSCFPVNVVFVCSQVREKPTLYYRQSWFTETSSCAGKQVIVRKLCSWQVPLPSSISWFEFITRIVSNYKEGAFNCVENSPCSSFKVASSPRSDGKSRCELLTQKTSVKKGKNCPHSVFNTNLNKYLQE